MVCIWFQKILEKKNESIVDVVDECAFCERCVEVEKNNIVTDLSDFRVTGFRWI